MARKHSIKTKQTDEELHKYYSFMSDYFWEIDDVLICNGQLPLPDRKHVAMKRLA